MSVATLVDNCRGAGARVYALEGRIRVEGALPLELTASLTAHRKAVGALLVAEAEYDRLYAEWTGTTDREGVTPEVEAMVAGPYGDARERYLALGRRADDGHEV